jgi:hypothetical protein
VLRSIAFLLVAACASVCAKEPTQTPEAGAKFVGAVGCRSSSCHGGAGEKRSQYITWSQKDFHIRAYAILLDARSARIGEAVGVSQPQSSARCTICHSPFQAVAQTRLTSTARPDEGVSCESCHGAAEPWLRGHTRPDWTYATRVSAGMHDLRNLYVRANACVACHQNVDADILKAGHPELVFELDSQSVNEPKHWRDDDRWSGVRSWLTGQAVALREVMWALNTQSAPSDEMKAQGSALGWLLFRTTEAVPSLPPISSGMLKVTDATQKAADELAHVAAAASWSEASVRGLLVALASTEKEFTGGLIVPAAAPQRAQRLVLALDRLSAALGVANLEKELSALRSDVQRHYDFDVAAFAEHLRAFRAKL